jgi:hypothetical protein
MKFIILKYYYCEERISLLIFYFSLLNYILRLNTTLSEKITFPATNPTMPIIGKLIVAPAIPVDIPIRIDSPKDRKITTRAYHCG